MCRTIRDTITDIVVILHAYASKLCTSWNLRNYHHFLSPISMPLIKGRLRLKCWLGREIEGRRRFVAFPSMMKIRINEKICSQSVTIVSYIHSRSSHKTHTACYLQNCLSMPPRGRETLRVLISLCNRIVSVRLLASLRGPVDFTGSSDLCALRSLFLSSLSFLPIYLFRSSS